MFKRSLLFLIFIGLISCSNGYNKIPQELRDVNRLVKNIIPFKKCDYWCYAEGHFASSSDKIDIIYQVGEKPKSLKFKDPGPGLFVGCAPLLCYKYITYVNDGKVIYVNNADDLKKFIGPVDNIEEALLIGLSDGLEIDNDTRGGTYKVTDQGYELLLTHFINCPITKESVYLKFNKSGLIEKTPQSVFHKEKGCIVY
ncbi:hypothetical protein GCM10023149_19690 [Mucilaginibacter gynuensis]|uniref:Lipoprotein n=1 Tax=Mucilaginibacter gynuensis TaxID=1302236 RepID=A0ABP8GAC7_9SPHI